MVGEVGWRGEHTNQNFRIRFAYAKCVAAKYALLRPNTSAVLTSDSSWFSLISTGSWFSWFEVQI